MLVRLCLPLNAACITRSLMSLMQHCLRFRHMYCRLLLVLALCCRPVSSFFSFQAAMSSIFFRAKKKMASASMNTKIGRKAVTNFIGDEGNKVATVAGRFLALEIPRCSRR